ncbi:hypothetical protein HWV62_913 [Athelia sp. TMB]|nr:hypothetical protein HWV62_913 [Athelia sp. TMB]
MPYINVDHHTSLWYTTNSFLTANVGGFDPAKSTILMLHPMFLDSSWLASQFDDPRLDDHYNLIAFDLRVCGQSKCKPSDVHDSWVDAADLAFAHQVREVIVIDRWVHNCYEELLWTWSFAEDLESFELAGADAAALSFGKDYDPEILDQLMDFWALHARPAVRLRTVEMFNVFMNRSPLTKEELAQIRHPVLIIQAEQCSAAPMQYAEQLAGELRGALGGAYVYTLKGVSAQHNDLDSANEDEGLSGPPTILPGSASIVNRVLTKFLSALPFSGSELIPPVTPVTSRMKAALGRLADLSGDETIESRDPSTPSSFSRVSEGVKNTQAESFKAYEKNLCKAFSPLDLNGKPHRRSVPSSLSNSPYDFDLQYEDSELATAFLKRRLAEQTVKANPPTPPISRRASVDSLLKKGVSPMNPLTPTNVMSFVI